jgi:hypothetical protein
MWRYPDGTFRQNPPVRVNHEGYLCKFANLVARQRDEAGYNEAVPLKREPFITYETEWVKGDDMIYREVATSTVVDEDRRAQWELDSVRIRRSMEYPPIGDQLDALIKELNSRRLAGDNLTAEMDSIVNKCLAVKKNFPKPTLDEEKDL